MRIPFNRTSMESKRAQSLGSDTQRCRLLIEPVWNRNKRLPTNIVSIY